MTVFYYLLGTSGKGKEESDAPVRNKIETMRLEQKKNLVFGIPLREVIINTPVPPALQSAAQPLEIPLLVRRCVDYVEQIGLQEEGIYRISGNQADQKELRERFDAGLTAT